MVALLAARTKADELLLWVLVDTLLKQDHVSIPRMKGLLRDKIANMSSEGNVCVPTGKEQLYRDALSVTAQKLLQGLLEDPPPHSN
jgi:hypothetical protein